MACRLTLALTAACRAAATRPDWHGQLATSESLSHVVSMAPTDDGAPQQLARRPASEMVTEMTAPSQKSAADETTESCQCATTERQTDCPIHNTNATSKLTEPSAVSRAHEHPDFQRARHLRTPRPVTLQYPPANSHLRAHLRLTLPPIQLPYRQTPTYQQAGSKPQPPRRPCRRLEQHYPKQQPPAKTVALIYR